MRKECMYVVTYTTGLLDASKHFDQYVGLAFLKGELYHCCAPRVLGVVWTHLGLSVCVVPDGGWVRLGT